MANVLIAGGNGLIGRRLSRMLVEKGFSVAWLARKKSKYYRTFFWNIEDHSLDPDALTFADYLIQLTGHNLSSGRWTEKKKKAILHSRVRSCSLLYRSFTGNAEQLKGYLAASAIGYYGNETGQKIFTEEDASGRDFLADVCRQWEDAHMRFHEVTDKVVIVRTGIVLSPEGGVFPKILRPFRFGLGTILGSGRQYFPWIHIDDLCGFFIHAIEQQEIDGVFNAVAPELNTHRTFMTALAQTSRKPIWLPPIPVFLLRLILGEMSSLILQGSRISSEKMRNTGYRFRFPDLKSALADLMKYNENMVSASQIP
jgi:uncharacterized protein